MSITRQGPCHAYFEYICNSALTNSKEEKLPDNIKKLLAPGTSYVLYIPAYQRGVAWELNDIKEFFESDSPLMGNVILGSFNNNQINELVDGLQRFAIGTSMLYYLWESALKENALNPSAYNKFRDSLLSQRIKIYQPIVEHNHNKLLNYPRRAISEQYKYQYQIIKNYIDKEIESNGAQFKDTVENSYLSRQISIDQYIGFTDHMELANTFIGLNTVRVELTAIDLLRSFIVQQAVNLSWDSRDINEIENAITETFVSENGKAKKNIEAFGKISLKCIEGRGNLNPTMVFPKWSTLKKVNVEEYLEFVNEFINLSEQDKNKYLFEISKMGGVPYSVVLLFFYKQFLNSSGTQSVFLSKIDGSNLYDIIRALYRLYIEGNVGRLNFKLEDIAKNTFSTNTSLADSINSLTGSGSLNEVPNINWMRNYLSKVDKNRSQRIFNACLLPHKSKADEFYPLYFGRKTDAWQIDHLIPESQLNNNRNQPGYDEGNTLRNFAPVITQWNRQMNNIPASEKIGSAKNYSKMIQYIDDQDLIKHPYLLWLIENTPEISSELDKMSNLLNTPEYNSIADKRIDKIVEYLKNL
jgi:hypothetical protein